MNALAALLVALCLVACAAPVDPWREANRKPLDTGSQVWWDKVKGNKQ